MRGVSVGQLVDFFAVHIGPVTLGEDRLGRTARFAPTRLARACEALNQETRGRVPQLATDMYAVDEVLIAPMTEDGTISLAELWNPRGLQAGFFISHAWGEDIGELMQGLYRMAIRRALDSHPDAAAEALHYEARWLNLYVFAFSARRAERGLGSQAVEQALLHQVLSTSSTREVVLYLDPGGLAVSRAWCALEFLLATELRKPLQICTVLGPLCNLNEGEGEVEEEEEEKEEELAQRMSALEVGFEQVYASDPEDARVIKARLHAFCADGVAETASGGAASLAQLLRAVIADEAGAALTRRHVSGARPRPPAARSPTFAADPAVAGVCSSSPPHAAHAFGAGAPSPPYPPRTTAALPAAPAAAESLELGQDGGRGRALGEAANGLGRRGSRSRHGLWAQVPALQALLRARAPARSALQAETAERLRAALAPGAAPVPILAALRGAPELRGAARAEAAGPIFQLLGHQNGEVRATAAKAFHTLALSGTLWAAIWRCLDEATCLASLVALLGCRCPEAPGRASALLAPDLALPASVVSDVLRGADAGVQLAALHALGGVRPSKEVASCVAALMDDPQPEVQRAVGRVLAAAERCGQAEEESVKILLDGYRRVATGTSAAPGARAAALAALGRSGAGADVEVLLSVAADPCNRADLRVASLQAVATVALRRPSPAPRGSLAEASAALEALCAGADDEVADAAAHALAGLASRGQALRARAQPLLAVQDVETRGRVERLLGLPAEADLAEWASTAAKCLGDPAPSVVKAALGVVALLEQEVDAHPEFIKLLLARDDETVRWKAALTLDGLGRHDLLDREGAVAAVAHRHGRSSDAVLQLLSPPGGSILVRQVDFPGVPLSLLTAAIKAPVKLSLLYGEDRSAKNADLRRLADVLTSDLRFLELDFSSNAALSDPLLRALAGLPTARLESLALGLRAGRFTDAGLAQLAALLQGARRLANVSLDLQASHFSEGALQVLVEAVGSLENLSSFSFVSNGGDFSSDSLADLASQLHVVRATSPSPVAPSGTPLRLRRCPSGTVQEAVRRLSGSGGGGGATERSRSGSAAGRPIRVSR